MELTEDRRTSARLSTGRKPLWSPRADDAHEVGQLLRLGHVGGMPLVMKQNESPDPVDVGFLGPPAVMAQPKRLPDLFQQPWLRSFGHQSPNVQDAPPPSDNARSMPSGSGIRTGGS